MPRRASRRASPPPPSSSFSQGRRRWLGLGILLVFGAGLPILLEASLRAFGVARPEPLLVRVQSGPLDVYQLNARVGRRYFPPEMERIMPKPGFRIFPVKKERGSLRIFVLGESSAAGFPYHTNGSFSGFLEDRLRVILPRRRVEVINCAMTAINSYAVVDFMKELRRYEPDMFVLYLGHNEYYGALGPASRVSFGRGHGAVWALRWILDLRTARLLRAGIEKLQGPPEPVRGQTVMEAMTGQTGIRRGDPIDIAAMQGFERNLRAAIRAVHGVPVLLCEQVSNLRDLPPFDSTHPPAMPAASRQAFDDLVARAREKQGEGDRQAALSLLDQAVALDSTHAEARYLRARLLGAAGRKLEARRDFVAAREQDGIPFRAPSAINRTIRRLARDENAVLVEVESAFDAAAPDGIPGKEIFFEHVHPRLDGQMRIADSIADILYRRELLGPRQEWDFTADRGREERLKAAALTPLDLEVADQRIFRLVHKWPFPEDPNARYASSRDPTLVQFAQAVLEHRLDLAEAHAKLAKQFLDRGELVAALVEYRAVCKIYPVPPENFVSAAQILLHLGRPAEAIPFLRQAQALSPGDPAPTRLLDEARRLAAGMQMRPGAPDSDSLPKP